MGDYEYERLTRAVLDLIPAENEEARERAGRLLRLVFRAGTAARLDHDFAKLANTDPLTRLAWLTKQGMVSDDVKALVREAEERREQDNAIVSMGGLTDSDLRSMLGEGFHTALRKATDHPYAIAVHRLIREMPAEDWGAIVSYVAGPIARQLRTEPDLQGARLLHDEFVNEVLVNAPESYDGDEAAEVYALRYVRDLEARTGAVQQEES